MPATQIISDKDNKIKSNGHDKVCKREISTENPREIAMPPPTNNRGDTINRNKLSKQTSKESESSKDISFRKSSLSCSGGESDSVVVTVVNPILQNGNSTLTVKPSRDTSSSSDEVLIDLHDSPKLPPLKPPEVLDSVNDNMPSLPASQFQGDIY